MFSFTFSLDFEKEYFCLFLPYSHSTHLCGASGKDGVCETVIPTSTIHLYIYRVSKLKSYAKKKKLKNRFKK